MAFCTLKPTREPARGLGQVLGHQLRGDQLRRRPGLPGHGRDLQRPVGDRRGFERFGPSRAGAKWQSGGEGGKAGRKREAPGKKGGLGARTCGNHLGGVFLLPD